jgi:hypothetical protein
VGRQSRGAVHPDSAAIFADRVIMSYRRKESAHAPVAPAV